MRTLTANAQSKVDTALGTEPIIVIKIEWTSGTVYYSDKTITIGAISAIGAITEFSAIDLSKNAETSSEVATVSFSLSDTEGDLKTIINTDIIENTPVTIYHFFVGNDQADLTQIFKGNLVNPVVWDEAGRTLQLEAESSIDSTDAGYAPEEDSITDLAPDAVGVPWPMGFGTCIHVPCVKIKKQPKGYLQSGINHNFNTFVIENGVDFPQGESISILIGKYQYTGTFDGNTFTATAKNEARHEDLAIAERPVNDPQYDDPKVLWLDSDAYIRGLYCIVNHAEYGWMVNLCVAQTGRKCYFRKPWRPNNTYLGIILNSTSTIDETAPCPRADWAVTYVIEATFWYYDERWDPRDGYIFGTIKVQDSYGIQAGEIVKLVTDYNDLYVANLLPSIEILDVFAYRQDGDKKVFVPIPSSYYTASLSNTLDGNNATTIEMLIPLEEREEENWDDEVYVSYRSTVGPNAASIIKFLLETYTDYSVDTTSYNSVASKVSKYWANFARFDKEDALQLCEQIAWQSRIALIMRDDTIYMKYLSELPTTDLDVDGTNIEDQTLQLSFKNTDELVTKLIAKWKLDYSGRPESEKSLTYENNTDIFKTIEKEIDMFIYNVYEFVKLSTYWWGYRYSNSWRQISFACFLEGLGLEIFDTIEIDTPILSDNAIQGTVLEANNDSNSNSVVVGLELASKAGDVDDSDEPEQDNQYYLGDPNFDVNEPIDPDDPGDDRDEIDYDVPDYDEDSGDDDEGDKDDGDGTQAYTFQFDVIPEEIQRGVNFSMTITIRDYLGNIVNVNKSATLLFTSSDGSDTFNLSNISFVNGSYSTSAAQIASGSGSDTGALTVAASGVTSAQAAFSIIDALSTLSWDTSPSSVTRESVFTVEISGGSAALVLDVSLNSSDPDDVLYDSSGPVTQITLDGSGEFSAADWEIRGGTLDAIGSITLQDATRVYDDATCDQFDISGLAVQNVKHTLIFDDSGIGNALTSIIAAPAAVDSGMPFTLTATRKDSDGNTVTSFQGYFTIQVFDNGLNICNFLDAGPDANNYGSYIVAKATNGVWSYTGTKITVPTPLDSPATFYVKEAYAANWEGSDTAVIAFPYFTVEAPTLVDRDTPFNVVITAYNGDDTLDTDYAPSTLVGLDWTLPDSSDIASPAIVSQTGWVNGSKTISCLVSGGTADGSYTVEAIDLGNQSRVGEDTGYVAPTAPCSCPGGLAANYTLDWTGSCTRSRTPLPASPVTVSGLTCSYSVFAIGGTDYYAYMYLDEPNCKWIVEILKTPGMFSKTAIIAEKVWGATPIGEYEVTYRNTSDFSPNTVDGIVIS